MKNSSHLFLLILICVFTESACGQNQSQQGNMAKVEISKVSKQKLNFPKVLIPVNYSDEEWKAILPDMNYFVLREKGTERAFTGKYWDHHKDGVYLCRGCKLPLFNSNTKFESGTGWPSFYKPVSSLVILEIKDVSHGMVRTEAVCAQCKGHLGHVFDDGPKPTGLRYCMNSASLEFVDADWLEETK